MDFRECRILLLNNIFSEIKNNISFEETFMILGGMKMSIYVVKNKKYKLFFPSGISENDTVEICKNYDISFEYVSISNFLNMCKKNEHIFDDFYFTISATSNILNQKVVDNLENNMMGQSEFLITSVDFKSERINLMFDRNLWHEYWISLTILREIENKTPWTSDSTIKVLKIEKKSIRKSNTLRKKIYQNENELMLECLKNYNFNKVTEYGDYLTRIEGPDAFAWLANVFGDLKKALEVDSVSETKNKYVLLLMKYFNSFIIAGTDSFYRNEFLSTLKYVDKKANSEEINNNIEKWSIVANDWRKFGRNLGRLIEKKRSVDSLEFAIDFLQRIELIENRLIAELEHILINKRR